MERKIFNVGLPKTGTVSLDRFLFSHGFRTKHFVKFDDANTLSDIKKVISNFDFFSDCPFSLLTEWLFEEYPDAIFLCTCREKQSWLKSVENHMLKHKNMRSNIHRMYSFGSLRDFSPTLSSMCFELHNERIKLLQNKTDVLFIPVEIDNEQKARLVEEKLGLPNKEYHTLNVGTNK